MPSSSLVFDEKEHTYTVKGRELPSVTQLMTKYGLIDTRFYNLQAMFRGTYVHRACQFYDEGDLNFESLDPVVQPYFEAYIRFKRESEFIVDKNMIERPMYSELYNFAGTPDRCGWINGHYVLIDIKTGSTPKWVKIQLAGYRKLIEENGWVMPVKHFSLELRANGSYRLNPVSIIDIYQGVRVIEAMLLIEKEVG